MVERVPLLGDVQGAQPRQTQGACADEGILSCAGCRAARRRRHEAGGVGLLKGEARAGATLQACEERCSLNTVPTRPGPRGRETPRRGPGQGNQPDVGDPTERRYA